MFIVTFELTKCFASRRYWQTDRGAAASPCVPQKLRLRRSVVPQGQTSERTKEVESGFPWLSESRPGACQCTVETPHSGGAPARPEVSSGLVRRGKPSEDGGRDASVPAAVHLPLGHRGFCSLPPRGAFPQQPRVGRSGRSRARAGDRSRDDVGLCAAERLPCPLGRGGRTPERTRLDEGCGGAAAFVPSFSSFRCGAQGDRVSATWTGLALLGREQSGQSRGEEAGLSIGKYPPPWVAEELQPVPREEAILWLLVM